MQGEIAALVAACLWAVASAFYGHLGTYIPAVQLNLIKGVVAIALFLVTITVTGGFTGELYPKIPIMPLYLLSVSGIVGIGLGDSAFFKSINALGARRALLVQTLTPPITAILSLIFIKEQLSIVAWCGILLVILGVGWVITERTPDDINCEQLNLNLSSGISFGVFSAFAGASGAVLSRAALNNIEGVNINPLWAALIRLSAGVVFLLPFLRFQSKGQKIGLYSQLKSVKFISAILFAAFCGTYLGLWLQQTAIKFTAAGIASTLMQTSPVFIIPIAMSMGEKISIRAILGVVIALLGIAVLFYQD
ncbi:MAG: DMT family transporter [Cyanobacteria bacterium P01_A01_bin.84]